MLQAIRFHASWCGPCRVLDPIWKNMADQVKDVDFVSIDIDSDPDTTARHKIMAVPTIVFVKDGVEVGRIVGLPEEKDIQEAIDKLK